MIFKCKCGRRYKNEEDKNACEIIHNSSFKYENDLESLVVAAGVKGIISRPVKMWEGNSQEYLFSKKASKTGSKFYHFCPLDKSLRSTKRLIHEDDITKIIVHGLKRKEQIKTLLEDLRKVREEYGKPIRIEPDFDEDGYSCERNFYEKFVIHVNKDGIKKYENN